MNTTTVRPELTAFLSRVRGHLADLSEEQRDELLDGLEADLAEQLAAGDPLPDPAAYAAELRAAAGIAAPSRWPAGATLLDRGRAEWLRWTAHNDATRSAWELAQAVRPAWWVLRAWVAVTLIDQASGPWERVTMWPTLGVPLLGPLVLLAAVVVSVLIGQGRLWPGSGPERTTAARVVLLLLNVVAVLAPLSFHGDGSQIAYTAVSSPTHQPWARDALHVRGQVIRNIYAYDANGRPLSGIQLFDQLGRPVAVSSRSSMGEGRDRQVTCPALNGSQELWNVFPLAEVTRTRGLCRPEDAASATPPVAPLASVPAVSAGTVTP